MPRAPKTAKPVKLTKPTKQAKKTWKYYLGMVLFIYSFIPYIIAFLLPLFGVSVAKLVTYITISIVSAEVAFFISIVLLGKTIIHRIKSTIRKFFFKNKKKKTIDTTKPVVIGPIRHRIGIALLILSAAPYPLAEIAMFFGYPRDGQHIAFLLMLLAGDAVFVGAFFVLGSSFLEKVKKLFQREEI